MKLVLCIFLLVSGHNIKAASYDFKIDGYGSFSNFDEAEKNILLDLQYLKLAQTLKTKNIKCEIGILATSIQYPENKILISKSEVDFTESFCQLKQESFKLSLGLLGLDWSEGLGIVSADEFNSYDFRISPFVTKFGKFYQPTFLVENFFSSSTYSAFVSYPHKMNIFRVPETSLLVVDDDKSYKNRIEYGLRGTWSFSNFDFQFGYQHLNDRKTVVGLHDQIGSSYLLRKYNQPFDHLFLGISKDFLGGVLRFDTSFSKFRQDIDTLLELKKYDRIYNAITYDTPTMSDIIISFQISNEDLSKKEYQASELGNVSNWISIVSTIGILDEYKLDLSLLQNYKDQGKSYKAEFFWSLAANSNLSLAAEYRPPKNSNFFMMYENENRFSLNYELVLR